MAFLAVKSFRA